MQKRVRMGMVGGGEGSFIGAVHRMAAALHGGVDLVCGAFSGDSSRARQSGLALGLPEARVYDDWQQMFEYERALPAAERMQFVAIVTPNHLHAPVANAALAAGFHVLSDKPATRDVAEAESLQESIQRSGLLYALTHTYTGYPLIEEARERIARGDFGPLRRVMVDYSQGWLAQAQPDNAQAAWRLDPARAGVSCCMADIGTHAFNLLEYVSGKQVVALCADLRSVVPGRVLDDDGSVLIRMQNDIRGVLSASQISTGEENALSLRIYGELGSLEWHQQEPNTLLLKWLDRPAEILRTGSPWLGTNARAGANLPAGHPEGYLEAFANIYRRFADAVGDFPNSQTALLQGIDAGIRAMRFVETTVSSSQRGSVWLNLNP